MPLKTHIDDPPTLNMTPMIDIVFLLIIFFMVGTKFSELSEAEKKMDLKVPEVSDADTLTPAPDKRVISVFRDGSITLDRDTVTLTELTQRLDAARAEYSELGVVVRGDAEAIFQNVASVLNACRAAKINDLGISVRIAKRER